MKRKYNLWLWGMVVGWYAVVAVSCSLPSIGQSKPHGYGGHHEYGPDLFERILDWISNVHNILDIIGAVLVISAASGIITFVRNGKDGFPLKSTLVLVGSAIGFWMLNALIGALLYIMVPVCVVGILAAVYLHWNQIVNWTERATKRDLNKNGKIGNGVQETTENGIPTLPGSRVGPHETGGM